MNETRSDEHGDGTKRAGNGFLMAFLVSLSLQLLMTVGAGELWGNALGVLLVAAVVVWGLMLWRSFVKGSLSESLRQTRGDYWIGMLVGAILALLAHLGIMAHAV